MKKYYTIYKITNKINNKIYIGQHVTNNLNDSYMGSGKLIKKAITKYGLQNFKREFLHTFESFDEMNQMEARIVNAEFIKLADNYNLAIGGNGGCGIGMINTINHSTRESLFVSVSDERISSGELVPFSKGMTTVKDPKTGETLRVDINDTRLLDGELVGIAKGKLSVVDIKTDETMQVNSNDPRFLNGELITHSKGMVSVKNVSTGETCQVSVNDEKYINGELVNISTGMVRAKDPKTGAALRISTSDPRLISGELVGWSSGTTTVKDVITGEVHRVDIDDPRIKNGELVGVTKGMIMAKSTLTGETLQVTKDDSRLLSGEIVGINKGMRKIVNWKLQMVKTIHMSDFNYWSKLGWELGGCKDFSKYNKLGQKIPDENFRQYWEMSKLGEPITNISKNTKISYPMLRSKIMEFKVFKTDDQL
jgi:hypothetical protein